MSLTTVAELRSALGVGTLYSDSLLQESCDAADSVLLPMLWNNNVYNYAHSNTANTGTLYFENSVRNRFLIGQTVVVSGNGAKHNGSKTLTAVDDFSITYNINGNNTPSGKHLVSPLGQVAGDVYVDWTVDAAVQQAALMIAVDIWQARQTTSSGGNSPDFQPSPYKMGNTLLARVRGLIAHALSPDSMVG